MKQWLLNGFFSVCLFYLCSSSAAAVSLPFTDVNLSKEETVNAIQFVVEYGITNGTTSTTFSPGDPCLRKQMITFLYRFFGSPSQEGRSNPYADVKPTDYYYDAALWAYSLDLLGEEDDDGYFHGERPCLRKEMATYLYKVTKATKGTVSYISQAKIVFEDVLSDALYFQPVNWAIEKDITGGKDTEKTEDGKTLIYFRPEYTCTRLQMALFLYRYNLHVQPPKR